MTEEKGEKKKDVVRFTCVLTKEEDELLGAMAVLLKRWGKIPRNSKSDAVRLAIRTLALLMEEKIKGGESGKS